LFTTDESIGSDVAELFNFLTGFARQRSYRRVQVAPSHLRSAILEEIERTVAAHSEGSPSRILIKINALVDQACIEALYGASQAGVKIDLNVRGICCLRPGIPGISETIRVVSVVGRFLEHSRVYAFERGGEHVVYISSADLMPRNLEHRVELAVPIEDPTLRAEVLETVELCLKDNRNAWQLDSAGEWTRLRAPSPDATISAQDELMRLHLLRAGESLPPG
jgi:polyphosphate kinase